MSHLLHEALTVVIILSFVPMVAIAFGAGFVAVLQAITQVQEQSLTHLARLITLTVVLMFAGQQGYGLLEQVFLKALSLTNSFN
jgi:flagellar biosynthesis protein FliQ